MWMKAVTLLGEARKELCLSCVRRCKNPSQEYAVDVLKSSTIYLNAPMLIRWFNININSASSSFLKNDWKLDRFWNDRAPLIPWVLWRLASTFTSFMTLLWRVALPPPAGLSPWPIYSGMLCVKGRKTELFQNVAACVNSKTSLALSEVHFK